MLSLYKSFIFHKTCIILITIVTSTVLIMYIYILFNYQYDGNLDIQAQANKIEIINTKTTNNENIQSFGDTSTKSTGHQQIQNIMNPSSNKTSVIAERRNKPHDDKWELLFNNTWFIEDNVSMYEDHSEILIPTYLNFTILKQRYNTFIKSLKPIKNINGIIDDINPNQTRCKYKGKVFVIGINKSGTTSLNAALELLGYSHNASFTYWFKQFKAFNPRRFNGPYFYFRHFYDKLNVIFMNKYLLDSLISESFYSYNFGDSPYCFLYEMMDKLYPNSKFILMRRQSTWT
eukprot:431253_1